MCLDRKLPTNDDDKIDSSYPYLYLNSQCVLASWFLYTYIYRISLAYFLGK